MRYCFPFLFVRVSGLHRDKVCVLNVCVFTLSHAYTHTRKNTFIRVAGLHRDKARLLILTHWLHTHTHTQTHFKFAHSYCLHTNTYPHMEPSVCIPQTKASSFFQYGHMGVLFWSSLIYFIYSVCCCHGSGLFWPSQETLQAIYSSCFIEII